MATLREWARRLTGTIRRSRTDRDLQEELRFHLDLTAEEARRGGGSYEGGDRGRDSVIGRARCRPQSRAAWGDIRETRFVRCGSD